jgi:hypothetical protein
MLLRAEEFTYGICMHELEKFAKYTAYFHDGILFDIKHYGNRIEILMSSAEMDPEDMKDDILLSKDDSIDGCLHIEDVIDVKISNHKDLEDLFKTYDHGIILDFDIENGKIELGILWSNFHPKPQTNDFSVIEIEAKKIWWENIPHLRDRFYKAES